MLRITKRNFAFLAASFLLVSGAMTVKASADESHARAREICKGILDLGQRDLCNSVVGDSSYYELDAVDSCGKLFMSGEIVKCLQTVTDRHYDDAELALCDSYYLASQKISCLASSGYDGHGSGASCLDSKDLVRNLSAEALQDMKVGEYAKAEKILKRLTRLR